MDLPTLFAIGGACAGLCYARRWDHLPLAAGLLLLICLLTLVPASAFAISDVELNPEDEVLQEPEEPEDMDGGEEADEGAECDERGAPAVAITTEAAERGERTH